MMNTPAAGQALPKPGEFEVTLHAEAQHAYERPSSPHHGHWELPVPAGSNSPASTWDNSGTRIAWS